MTPARSPGPPSESGPIANRLPTGPGSRGGRWHDPAFRRAYYRAWRAANPDYREREKLRRARKREELSGEPTGVLRIADRRRSLPLPAFRCRCPDCACREAVVTACGFCRDGLHLEEKSA